VSVPTDPATSPAAAAGVPTRRTSTQDDTTVIRSREIRVRQEDLVRLLRAATRWPEVGTATDRSQGVRLVTLQDLHEVDRGGHVTAREQPDSIASELSEAFRPQR
jgi:hypothetical protein